MKFIPAIISLLGLLSAPAALAQGCCGPQNGAQAGCNTSGAAGAADHENHAGMQPAAASYQSPGPRKVSVEPVQSVYDNMGKSMVHCGQIKDRTEPPKT